MEKTSHRQKFQAVTVTGRVNYSQNAKVSHGCMGLAVCRPPEEQKKGIWGPRPSPHVVAMLKGRLALRVLGGKDGETLTANVSPSSSQLEKRQINFVPWNLSSNLSPV